MRTPFILFALCAASATASLTACGSVEATDVALADVTTAGRVIDRLSGAPIAGAEIATAEGARAVSDADGRFVVAGQGAVLASAPGYLALRRAADATTGTVELRLFPAATSDADDERLSVRFAAQRAGDPALGDATADLRPAARVILARLGDQPALSLADVADVVPRAALARAGEPVMPATIRVWRRRLDGSTASCSGRVDVIPFDKYVKGVLPHEWIPSWDPKSLEMGAVAIRTYAASWVASGGKYDCADLDDTTASQVYEDEFLPKTDAAVDATAGMVIVKAGALVFAEYSAENSDPTAFGVDEPHCTGKALFGHGRGTCQWGTQRWATTGGKDYHFMSAHYYPGATLSIPGPRYAAEYAAAEHPMEMTSGDEVVVWVEYVNQGGVTWDVDQTRLGTAAPRDRASAFYKEGNWLAPNRASGADHSGYGPGVTGRFTFVLKAPEVDTTTTFTESFALVQEGEAWFGAEDDHVTWTIIVNPRNGNGSGDDGGDGSGDSSDGDGSGAGGEEPNDVGGSGCNVVGPGAAATTAGGAAGALGLTRGVALFLLAAAASRRGRRIVRVVARPKTGFLAAFFGMIMMLFVGACAAESPDSGVVVHAPGSALGGDSTLVPIFRAAGVESGVPAELLAALSFEKTRLRMNLGRDADHSAPEYGLMALGEGGAGDVFAAAVRLGLSVDAVKTDATANVRAAAFALGREAERQGVTPRALADWAPIVAAYNGGHDQADAVMRRLERGFRGKDTDGRWLVVSARALGGTLEGLSRQSYALGYPGAIWNPANPGNFSAGSRGAAQINYIVIHTVQGSYAGCISWFKNSASNVSSHYVVRSSDGQVTQMVDDSDVAYHDACFNSESIGIEHEGFVDDPDAWYTAAMYASSAKLTAWIADAYGIPKDRQHIYGHGDAPDCSDYTDPGSGWNWEHYMALVQTGGEPKFDAGASSGAQTPPATMVSGEEAVVWFEFPNAGNVSWGLDETRLGTAEPEDRASPFYKEGNWLAPNRPTGADHSGYGPGDTGRFTFAIVAPEVESETTFVETFRLVQEGVTWFGPTVTFTVTVKPRAGQTPPGSSTEPRPPSIGGDGDEENDVGGGGCAVSAGHAGAGAGGAAGFALLVGCAILVLGASVRRRR